MHRRFVAVIAGAVLAMIGMGGAIAQPTPAPQPGQVPAPARPPTPPPNVVNPGLARQLPQNPLPPAAVQTNLPPGSVLLEPMTVSNFRVIQRTCRDDLSGAFIQIEAELAAPPGPADQTGTIAVAIGSRLQAAASARASNGVFRVNRQFFVGGGATGETAVQFVHNGSLRSPPMTVRYACIAPTSFSREPGRPTLPDIGFAGPVIIDYLVGREGSLLGPTTFLGEARFYYVSGLQNNAVRVNRDVIGALPLHRLTSLCPDEGEAFVTVSLFAALRMERFANLEPYAPGMFIHIDARHRDNASTDNGSRGPTAGRSALPMGYEWARYNLVLPCTREGRIDIRLDPDNRLMESDETNNRLQFTYDLIGP